MNCANPSGYSGIGLLPHPAESRLRKLRPFVQGVIYCETCLADRLHGTQATHNASASEYHGICFIHNAAVYAGRRAKYWAKPQQ